jgi:hypothetical protein
MNTTEMKGRIGEASPRFKARITGIFYLLTIVTGLVVLFAHGRLGLVLELIASVCYVAMTALFYALTRE